MQALGSSAAWPSTTKVTCGELRDVKTSASWYMLCSKAAQQACCRACRTPCRSTVSVATSALCCSVRAIQLRPCCGRLGAAKALAGCAAELGRPGMEAVAGEVALEALRAAVAGLRLADRDAPGTGTQEALADALKARAARRRIGFGLRGYP